MYLCIMVPYICKLYIRMQHNYCNKSVCNTIIAIFANYISECNTIIAIFANYISNCNTSIAIFANYLSECNTIIAIIANYISKCNTIISISGTGLKNLISNFESISKIDLWDTDGGAKCWSRRVKMARADVSERRKMLHEARSKNRWRV